MYKHENDKKLFRLIDILSKLYRNEQFTIADYAREYNVSTRTIQRDFNERLISFPIYQENKIWKMNRSNFVDNFLLKQ